MSDAGRNFYFDPPRPFVWMTRKWVRTVACIADCQDDGAGDATRASPADLIFDRRRWIQGWSHNWRMGGSMRAAKLPTRWSHYGGENPVLRHPKDGFAQFGNSRMATCDPSTLRDMR
jgi:hypothetical protein